MKWLFVFMYWLITWILKYVINIFELIWYIDIKHFSYYGTYFLSIESIKEHVPDYSITPINDGFNFIERFVYRCVCK
jgi:hypothetical protein